MHDVLRQRLLRRIESLPDAQIYQVLDYIEFLESKYADSAAVETTGLQRFAEGLEDKLRRKAVSPNTIREAFQLISAADRVLSGVSSAGRQILADLGSAAEGAETSTRASGRRAGQRGAASRAEEGGSIEQSARGERGRERAPRREGGQAGEKREGEGRPGPESGPGHESRPGHEGGS